MKIIVAHTSPDLDAIISVWLIKKFLPGWENAEVRFVPAGERISNIKYQISNIKSPIEQIEGNEVIHVDTGMGYLDHHQTDDINVSAASLTFDYVKRVWSLDGEKQKDREEAIERIVRLIVDVDHFQEVFWDNPTADFHELSLIGILEGLKFQKPDQDEYYIDFIRECLDALLHDFENRIWAEKEIKERAKEFETKWGKGLAIESINDTVIKLAQKMGYAVVVRKDPRKGYVRIKARPVRKLKVENGKLKIKDKTNSQLSTLNSQLDIDLTLVYEKLRKMDPEATWYLHVSKKMLLNGTIKNPNMKPTKLSLDQIIKVLEDI